MSALVGAYALAGLTALGLMAYLVVALLRSEDF